MFNLWFDDTEEKSVLLATGSADPYAYLYNIGEVRAIDLLQYVCISSCTKSALFLSEFVRTDAKIGRTYR